MKTKEKKNRIWSVLSWKARLIGLAVILVLVAAAALWLYTSGQIARNHDNKATVDVVPVLEKMVETSTLYTYTTMYNGILPVPNPDKPEKVDYHVAYCSTADVGFDISEIKFAHDPETKVITISLPQPGVDVTVDEASIETMPKNAKNNSIENSGKVYAACKRDAMQELARQNVVLQMAEENAENVIRKLTEPVLQQYDPEYKIAFAEEGAK